MNELTPREIRMKQDFLKVTYVSKGIRDDVILNVSEIASLFYGYNHLVLKTPLPNGSNYITLPKEEFDRVVEFLLEGAYV